MRCAVGACAERPLADAHVAHASLEARALAHKRRGRACDVRKLSKVDMNKEIDHNAVELLAPVPESHGQQMLAWERIEAPPRKIETVFRPPAVDEMLADIEAFLRKRRWYVKRAYKYQRVFMLHGPPGNGKSSFLQALAVQHQMPFFALQLSSGVSAGENHAKPLPRLLRRLLTCSPAHFLTQ